jgi:hypothetical protein
MYNHVCEQYLFTYNQLLLIKRSRYIGMSFATTSNVATHILITIFRRESLIFQWQNEDLKYTLKCSAALCLKLQDVSS